MRNKPRGRKYRNLYARKEVIWLEKLVHGRRIRRSCKTDDWDMAAAVRDEYERQTGGSRLGRLTVPKFADLADRYLEWTTHLAPTTQDDRRGLLRTGAPGGRTASVLRAISGGRDPQAATPRVVGR